MTESDAELLPFLLKELSESLEEEMIPLPLLVSSLISSRAGDFPFSTTSMTLGCVRDVFIARTALRRENPRLLVTGAVGGHAGDPASARFAGGVGRVEAGGKVVDSLGSSDPEVRSIESSLEMACISGSEVLLSFPTSFRKAAILPLSRRVQFYNPPHYTQHGLPQ